MKQKFTGIFLIVIVMVIVACSSINDNKQPGNDPAAIDETAETAAIMKVIEGETACFFNGDYDCWAKHWSHENYIYQAWNNDDGTADVAIGWEKISARSKEWIEKYYKNGKNVIHPVVRREHPSVRFYSNKTAYLVWKQYNADKDKKYFRTSEETRIMEKEEDGWKIVNVSAFWDTQAKIPFDSLKIN